MGILKQANNSADALVKVEGLWALFELIKTQWPFLLAMLSGGGMLSWASKATEWINYFGPIVWVLSFFVGCFCVLAIGILWEKMKYMRLRRMQTSTLMSQGLNPLAPRFERQRVPLSGLFDPEYVSVKTKEFLDCDLYGPAILLTQGGIISQTSLINCQIILIDMDKPVQGGAMMFEDCNITRCTIRNVTLIMHRSLYDDLSDTLKANVPLVNGPP